MSYHHKFTVRSQSVLVLCSFHSVCSLFGSPPHSPLPPACLTLLNSELWHQTKAFGSAALLRRTDWPCRSPAARTLAAQLWDRCRWPALLLSLMCSCVCACASVLLCLRISQSFLTFSAASAASVQTCYFSVGLERSIQFHFSHCLFLLHLSRYRVIAANNNSFVIMPNPRID